MATSTHLLVTDQQQTVFCRGGDRQVFSPFGFGARHALGFNGERVDGLTERYLLGHGYRAFSPALYRFVSPDSWSPFGEGGLNAYAYCLGDPVNARDPTGHSRWGDVKRFFGLGKGSRGASKASSGRVSSKKPVGDPVLKNTTSPSIQSSQRNVESPSAGPAPFPAPPYRPEDIRIVYHERLTIVELNNGATYRMTHDFSTERKAWTKGSDGSVWGTGGAVLDPNNYPYSALIDYRYTPPPKAFHAGQANRTVRQ